MYCGYSVQRWLVKVKFINNVVMDLVEGWWCNVYKSVPIISDTTMYIPM